MLNEARNLHTPRSDSKLVYVWLSVLLNTIRLSYLPCGPGAQRRSPRAHPALRESHGTDVLTSEFEIEMPDGFPGSNTKWAVVEGLEGGMKWTWAVMGVHIDWPGRSMNLPIVYDREFYRSVLDVYASICKGGNFERFTSPRVR